MSADNYRALMRRLLEALPTMTEAEQREMYEVRTRQDHGLRSEVSTREHRFFVEDPADWGTETAANPPSSRSPRWERASR